MPDSPGKSLGMTTHDALQFHAQVAQLFQKLGLGDYATYVFVLAGVLALAGLIGGLNALLYRKLTPQEIEEMMYDPDRVHLAAQGRVLRF